MKYNNIYWLIYAFQPILLSLFSFILMGMSFSRGFGPTLFFFSSLMLSLFSLSAMAGQVMKTNSDAYCTNIIVPLCSAYLLFVSGVVLLYIILN